MNRNRPCPGIGDVTAQSLIAMLPELGHVTAKRAAALVGIAPFAHDSGPKKGKRSIWGGRASLRAALYMATLSSIRWAAAYPPGVASAAWFSPCLRVSV